MPVSNNTSDSADSVGSSLTLEELVEMAKNSSADKYRATDSSGAIGRGVWDSTPPLGTGLGGIHPWPPVNPSPDITSITHVESSNILQKIIDYTDDEKEIHFSGGFKVTTKELKICIKMLLKQAKEEYPEEFI